VIVFIFIMNKNIGVGKVISRGASWAGLPLRQVQLKEYF
jgi:hypothetical protein